MIFRIIVKKRIELISWILDKMKEDGKISFEGNLREKVRLKVFPELKETELLKRNTTLPPQEFWIFNINQTTKSYIKRELLNAIGLRENVSHILIEQMGKLIFCSYDSFNKDSVLLSGDAFANEWDVRYLEEQGIITDWYINSDSNLNK